jgi:hypothetical protein
MRIDHEENVSSAEESRPPRVFISYAHGAEDKLERVQQLCTRLRGDCVDCYIDQAIAGVPPGGWDRWMEEQIETADYVLVVYDQDYHERVSVASDSAPHGAAIEERMLRQLRRRSHRRSESIIVVQWTSETPLPLWLEHRYRLDAEYEPLFRHLTAQPKYKPPPLGMKRIMPSGPAPVAEVPPSDLAPAVVDTQLEQSIRDLNPERAAELAMESSAATSYLEDRLAEIDPNDLQTWITRVVERWRVEDVRMIFAAEVSFFALGRRLLREGLPKFDESALARLFERVSQFLVVRWDNHPPAPLTIDLREKNLYLKWWATCWTWSFVVPPPSSRPPASLELLFPRWFRLTAATVNERRSELPMVPWGPEFTEDVLTLVKWTRELAKDWVPQSAATVHWMFVPVALLRVAEGSAKFVPSLWESLRGDSCTRVGVALVARAMAALCLDASRTAGGARPRAAGEAPSVQIGFGRRRAVNLGLTTT